jgi:hypothetical protein
MTRGQHGQRQFRDRRCRRRDGCHYRTTTALIRRQRLSSDRDANRIARTADRGGGFAEASSTPAAALPRITSASNARPTTTTPSAMKRTCRLSSRRKRRAVLAIKRRCERQNKGQLQRAVDNHKR